ncbi:MAG TPA: SDR family oxidoreductase [Acetobacteraceae bacterium]|nr:SDR family oxidoreductase [Acetobacteraceae bacterium]
MDFADSRVVITGAAGTFGGWIAQAFASEGARLCLSDIRADALAETAARLNLDPARTLTHPTDLMQEASIGALAELVRSRWGAPDIVVNNAGLYPRGPRLIDLPAEEWDRIMGVNVRAPFLVSCAMARLMIDAGVKGSIVTIGSGAARQMRATSVPYCTSKTAVERLSKGLALELAPHGIRVNVVEPGFAPGSEVSVLPEDYVAKMRARIPLGRTSEPGDAAGAVLYLCSARAGFITGAVLSVDGGNSIGTFEPPG